MRLVALAAHKFLLDVAHDALQFQRIRSAASTASAASAASSLLAAGGGGASGSRVVLTMEDLAARCALLGSLTLLGCARRLTLHSTCVRTRSLKEYGVNLCKPEYFSDVAHEPQ